ncbi:MAG: tetratricopeptide repeat protein [Bacteroidetes bacterium]|nr:tetratricopeptide repeat protein [Bacteroidota bacterium]
MKSLFVFILLCIRCICISQSSDSVITRILKSHDNKPEKLHQLNKVSEDLWLMGNYKESKYLADTLLAMEEAEIKKTPSDKSLLKEQAYTYNNLAIIYRYKGDYSASIEYHLKALKIREAIHDTWGIARSNLGLGTINEFLDKKDIALGYKFKALKLFEQANDSMFIAITCNHIASLYFSLGKIDEAEKYNTTSILIFVKKFNMSGMADAYSLAGQIYETRQNYTDAINNYKTSLTFKNFLGFKDGIIDGNLRLGTVYTKLNQLGKARKHLDTALVLSNEVGSKINQSSIYRALATIDSISHDNAGALKNYKLYIAYRDSLINQQSAEKISKLQAEFENQKRLELQKIEEEKERLKREEHEQHQQMIIYLICGGLFLLSIGMVIIYRSYRIKQKSNQLLSEKNKIIETQKHLVEEKQTEIIDSINYARRIQYSLLASDKLLQENLPDYFLYFQPKDVVSGDFYWASRLNNGQFILVIADSTGHGVPGAIMSMLNMNCLNEAVHSDKLYEPAEILNATRRKIISYLANDGSESGGKDGMDCSLVRLDFKTNRFMYAAANNPIWIVRQKAGESLEILELEADRMPVSKHEKDHIPFTQKTVEVLSGDMIYMFTDGFADQFGGPKGKKYKYKPLQQLFFAVSQRPPAEQKELIQAAFQSWKGDLEQVDDICVIGIRIN